MRFRKLEFLVFLFSLLVIIASIFFNKNMKPVSYFKQNFVNGEIIEIEEEKLNKDPYVDGRYLGYQKLKVKILEGDYRGKEFEVNNSITKQHNILGKTGLKLIFTIKEKGSKMSIWPYNYRRDKYIYLLAFLFVSIICLLGKLNGFRSLLALFFTSSVVIGILIPMIFYGFEPIISGIACSALIIVVSFILISGINKKSLAAILGTISGIIIAGTLSYMFGKIAFLSGVNMDKGEQILYLAKDYGIKVKGLMFVSILISSLGAVMDVAMSIASSSNELHNTNKNLNKKEHFNSLMNIGRDIMGTMTNTLILAFTGSSLTLIMMIWGYNMQYKQFINIPLISIEAIQGLAGSIGIVLTVPVTAIISTILLKNSKHSNTKYNFKEEK